MTKLIKVTPQPSITMKVSTTETGRKKDIKMMDDTQPSDRLRAWNPLVYSMRLFGLLKTFSSNTSCSVIAWIYAVITLFGAWGNTVRLFWIYSQDDTFGFSLLMKLSLHVWYVFSAVCITTTYRATKGDNKLEMFLVKWSQAIHLQSNCPPVVNQEAKFRRQVSLFVAVTWILLTLNVVFAAYCLFFTQTLDFSIAPITPRQSSALPMKIYVLITQTYMCASWLFTVCLFLIISWSIYLEFNSLMQDFRKAILPDGKISELEGFRRRHQEICHLVESADDVLNVFSAASLVSCTFCGMLILYDLVWLMPQSSDTFMIVSGFFWLASSLVALFVVSFGGGCLNHVAHSPLKVIHDINLTEVSTKVSLQMNMFLTKLTGESIGLTAMDMFVIDKPTILTIAGAFITYFIVLIQFQQQSISPAHPPVCNYTG